MLGAIRIVITLTLISTLKPDPYPNPNHNSNLAYPIKPTEPYQTVILKSAYSAIDRSIHTAGRVYRPKALRYPK